jgi:hypothetical protein
MVFAAVGRTWTWRFVAAIVERDFALDTENDPKT